jgi:DNA repair protein RadC
MNSINAQNNIQSLLADTLREKEDSLKIREIFSRYGTVHELLEVTEEELLMIKGIGPVKARQIVTVLRLARELRILKQEKYTVRSPEDAYQYMKGEMELHTKEHFVVMGLNTKNNVIFTETVSIGTINSALVHPREVYRPLIKRNAASAVVFHSHPSGDPSPSREDIEVTKRLKEVGEIVGVDLIDHLVIGHGRYVSLKEKGLM